MVMNKVCKRYTKEKHSKGGRQRGTGAQIASAWVGVSYNNASYMKFKGRNMLF